MKRGTRVLWIGLAVTLAACGSLGGDWVKIDQRRGALCRLVDERISAVNLRAAEYRREGLGSQSVLDDAELLPRGKIYGQMVASLSDKDLIKEINSKFSLSYPYEYAERLHRRGRDEEALRFAYTGLLEFSPVAYRTDGQNISYKNQFLKQYGGYPPSECLAYSLCADFGVKRPDFLADCEKLRK